MYNTSGLLLVEGLRLLVVGGWVVEGRGRLMCTVLSSRLRSRRKRLEEVGRLASDTGHSPSESVNSTNTVRVSGPVAPEAQAHAITSGHALQYCNTH